jgi:hypothetical protein
MKRPVIETFLSTLDHSLRWTGIPARVAAAMSDAPAVDRKRRPLRWIPVWPIAISCALFIYSLIRPSALAGSLSGVIVALLPLIHMHGPLGKPSWEDDEREASLRRASWLFSFGVLACLNCLGQPVLMILSHWLDWQIMQSMSVAISAMMLNGTLFGSLPTLYASWNLRGLPIE